jgi:hypothetical protein
MPEEYLTGLIPEENRRSLGNESVSNNVIDSVTFHLGLALAVAVGAYYFAAAALIGTGFQGILQN